MELLMKIYGVFKDFDKQQDLIKENKALRVALEQGNMRVAESILFRLIDSNDSKKRLEFLNGTISYCKKGRTIENEAKRIATRVLESDLEDITEQKGIDNIQHLFQFMMKKVCASVRSLYVSLEMFGRSLYVSP